MKRFFFHTPRFFRVVLCAFIVIAGTVLPAAAQTEDSGKGQYSWFFSGSLIAFPDEGGNNSAPMPIQFVPGAGFGLPFFDPLRLEITADMYFGTYGYDFTLNRPFPRPWESRSAFVWGSIVGVQAAFYWRPASNMAIRAFGGPAADLRLVLIAPDLAENPLNPMDEIQRETAAVTEYFWSSGRWFYPVAGAGMDFDLNENFRLGFDLRVWVPVFKLWTNENLLSIDGWRFGAGARITLR